MTTRSLGLADSVGNGLGINGLGRIGRALARVAHARADLRLAAVNDVAAIEGLVPLLRRDSVHGAWKANVELDPGDGGRTLRIDDDPVAVFREADPARVPWPDDVTVVVEASGAHDGAAAAGHLASDGPRLVVVSALVDGVDAVLCQGVPGHETVDTSKHRVVSNASCTTHCLALLLRVLHEAFGVRSALMDEVHGYTADQRLVDTTHPVDPRRGRAAAINIVPTYSAAPAAAAALLGLEGRVVGRAVRVPVPDVALLDVVAHLERTADVGALEDAFRAAAEGPLEGLLGVVDEPVVSTDLLGDPRSAVVDLGLLQAAGEQVRVSAWYDNEWGYVHRLADLVASATFPRPTGDSS